MYYPYFWTVRIKLCCFERLAAKTGNWVGESFFGDDHDTASRTPRTTSPQKQTLLRRGRGFRGVGELLPRTAGIFVFDVYKMLRFRF